MTHSHEASAKDVILRDAQTADTAAIVQLIRELAATLGETSPVTEAYVARYLSSPGSTMLLAETQGQIVGLLSYSLRPDLYHAGSSCLIEELVVQKAARRQGVGGILLAELLSRLARMDCAEVSVTVMPENEEAIRFYRKHGLTEEAVFLEKHLGCQHSGEQTR
jgi:ribosomal protein S18 acetylase RimI-like enzyme